MFIKNILKGFKGETKIKYYIGERLIEEYHTVSEYMKSGLTTYDDTEQGALEIEDDTIIIKI